MVITEGQENNFISAVQALVYNMSYDIPLTKASHMAELSIKGREAYFLIRGSVKSCGKEASIGNGEDLGPVMHLTIVVISTIKKLK